MSFCKEKTPPVLERQVMLKQRIFSIPFSTSTIVRDPSLRTDKGDLLLSMEYDDDGEERPFLLRFVKQRAFRKRAETYCTSWHVKDVYDTVCEVKESDWVAELYGDAMPEWRDRWVMRHFMVYIDGFGCLEVVADLVVIG